MVKLTNRHARNDGRVQLVNNGRINAPAGVAPAVLARVNAEFVKAIKSPELRPKIEQQDMEPTAPGHVEFNAMYRAELARWTRVAKDAGLKAD